MKKKLIAATIFIIAGGYTFSTWYTGNEIAKQINDEVENLNVAIRQIAPPDNQFQVSYSDYEQGIFSTSLRLQFKTRNQAVSVDQPITIYHGPFPWSDIRTGSFSPKMMSFYYQMTEQLSPTLWSLANNQPFISANLSIGYNNTAHLTIKTQPINYTVQQSTFELGTNHLSLEIDNHNNIDLALDINKLSLIQPTQSYIINGLTYQSDLMFSPLYTDINMQLNMKNLTIKNDDNRLNFKNITAQQSSKMTQHQMTSTAHLTIPALQLNQQDLGNGQLDLNYDLPLEVALNSLKDWSQLDKQDNPSTNLNIKKLTWQTPVGSLSADMQLSLMSLGLDLKQLHAKEVLSLDANASLPIKPFAYLWAQVSNSNQSKISDEEIAIAASQLVGMYHVFKPQLTILKLNHDDQNKPTGFTTELSYSQNQDLSVINDETINKEQFWSKLGLN